MGDETAAQIPLSCGCVERFSVAGARGARRHRFHPLAADDVRVAMRRACQQAASTTLALRRADAALVAAGAGGVAAVCAPPLTGALWPLPSAHICQGHARPA
mgnify:CR=1 FL=1